MKKLALACAVSALSAPAMAAPITQVFTGHVVVGDSLSDNRNTAALLAQLAPFLPPPAPPAVPPTPEEIRAALNFERLRAPGVLSDGPTWAASINGAFASAGKTGDNLAFAGATIVDNSATGDPVPDLLAQIFSPPTLPVAPGIEIQTYPDGRGGLLNPDGSRNTTRGLGSRPVLTVFAGGNDFLNAARMLDPAAADFSVIETAMGAAQATLQAGLKTLAGSGFQDLVVMNLPDFGRIPRFAGAPDIVRDKLSGIAGDYNAVLKTFLDGDHLFGATVTQVDIFAALGDAELIAGAGLTNTTEACIASVSLTATGCDGFLYFDDIHPTKGGHALIADLTRASLAETYAAPVPLPAPALMLLTALFGVGCLKRRKAAA